MVANKTRPGNKRVNIVGVSGLCCIKKVPWCSHYSFHAYYIQGDAHSSALQFSGGIIKEITGCRPKSREPQEYGPLGIVAHMQLVRLRPLGGVPREC